MTAEEKYIDSLLPVQRVVMAKAALAGVTYETTTSEEPVWAGGRMDFVYRQKVKCFMPDGREIGTFSDRYEAACWAVGTLEMPDEPEGVTLKGLFAVSRPIE